MNYGELRSPGCCRGAWQCRSHVSHGEVHCCGVHGVEGGLSQTCSHPDSRVRAVTHRGLPSPGDASLDQPCHISLGPKSAAFCSLSSRANRQDFQLRNLRIIEPNEVTPSGDKSVETGNSNFAYKLGGMS